MSFTANAMEYDSRVVVGIRSTSNTLLPECHGSNAQFVFDVIVMEVCLLPVADGRVSRRHHPRHRAPIVFAHAVSDISCIVDGARIRYSNVFVIHPAHTVQSFVSLPRL